MTCGQRKKLERQALEVTARSRNLAKYTHPNTVYQWLNRQFRQALLALLGGCGARTMLEVGCGEGFLLAFLAQHLPQASLAGLDLAPDATRYARAQCPAAVRLLVADGNRLPFKSSAFDVVLCSEVLEHLTDVEPALAELKRISRRYVVVSVPREPYFSFLTRLAIWLRQAEDPEHVQFWTRQDFARLVQEHFAKAKIGTCGIYRLALCEVLG